MAAIFDQDAALHRMGGDPQLFTEMVVLLQEDGPHLMQQFTTALAERDGAGVQHAAHTLKGLAANFGAMRTVRAAATAEQLARERSWDGLPDATEELSRALSELLAALQPHTASASKAV
jgi:HPt (histidine-containing phosphotransfer) domain-containing protein